MHNKRTITLLLILMTMLLGQGAAIFSLAEGMHQQGLDNTMSEHCTAA
jgi:hypothetical protein